MVRGKREFETTCPECGQVVGATQQFSMTGQRMWRSSLHYRKHGDVKSGRCIGSRNEVPELLVFDRRAT